MSDPEINNLLLALENETNSSIMNMTTSKIKTIKNNMLQKLWFVVVTTVRRPVFSLKVVAADIVRSPLPPLIISIAPVVDAYSSRTKV